MTISSEIRSTTPKLGNGTWVNITFTFKVFAASDIVLVQTTDAGVDSTLTEGSGNDYTVTLNEDQNSNPGGTITLTSVSTTGYFYTATSALENLQPTQITNLGGFLPATLNNAFDRLTILIQQVLGDVDRSLKFPLSDGTGLTSILPTKTLRANKAVIFDASGNVTTSTNDFTTVEANISTVAGSIGNVDIVAADLNGDDDIGTVAAELNADNDIETVADNITNVNNVGGSISNVDIVAGGLSNINAVAGNASNVNTVAGISADVTAVAGVSADVTTVAGIESDVTTVAADGTDIGTVAGISADVTAVAGVSSNVTTVAGNTSNINLVAAVDGDITTVAAVDSDVTTVAGISADVTTVAGIETDIGTIITNITAIQNADDYALALKGTSTTSTLIGTGSKTFTVEANKQFYAGGFVLVTSDANTSNYMWGRVTSYSSTTLIVDVVTTGGSGTFADWTIAVSGERGAAGAGTSADNVSVDDASFSILSGTNAQDVFDDIDDSGAFVDVEQNFTEINYFDQLFVQEPSPSTQRKWKFTADGAALKIQTYDNDGSYDNNQLIIQRNNGMHASGLSAPGNGMLHFKGLTISGDGSVSGDMTVGNLITSGNVDGRDVSADGSKLDGVASGATANSSDATLLARANHTGSQAASTISDAGNAITYDVASQAEAEAGIVANKLMTPERTAEAIAVLAGGSTPDNILGDLPLALRPDTSTALHISQYRYEKFYLIDSSGDPVEYDMSGFTDYKLQETGLSSLSADTIYYVYVYDNSGTMDIEVSSTAPSWNDTYKTFTKSGSPIRRFVAAFYTDGSGNLQPSLRNTWYNHYLKEILPINEFGSNGSTTSSYITQQTHNVLRNKYDAITAVAQCQYLYSSTSGDEIRFGLTLDGQSFQKRVYAPASSGRAHGMAHGVVPRTASYDDGQFGSIAGEERLEIAYTSIQVGFGRGSGSGTVYCQLPQITGTYEA